MVPPGSWNETAQHKHLGMHTAAAIHASAAYPGARSATQSTPVLHPRPDSMASTGLPSACQKRWDPPPHTLHTPDVWPLVSQVSHSSMATLQLLCGLPSYCRATWLIEA